MSTVEVNEFELILVQHDLKKKGIVNYKVRPGNDAVWVHFGNQDWYYIFRDGMIVDIQID